MTKDRLRNLVAEYEVQNALLSAECQRMFYSCGSMPLVVAIGGGMTSEESFASARKTYVRKSQPNSTKQKKGKKAKKKKSKHSLDWKKECPMDYNKKKGCVVDPVTKDCIPEEEIAGDRTGSSFSDGHCYHSKNLQSHARIQHAQNPKRKDLNLPSGKAYTRSDLEKLDKRRLESYAHETLLSSISTAVEQKINNTSNHQQQTFDAFLKELKASKDAPSRSSRWWKTIKGSISTWGVMKFFGKAIAWLASKGMQLGQYIARNPRTARFFLIMIKGLVNTFCQKMAISLGKARYKYKGAMTRLKDGAMNSEVLQMAGESMISGFSWRGAAKLAGGLFKGLVKSIPVVGNVAEEVGEAISGPVEEAAKFAAEAALYQQDLNKSFGSVLEILGLIVNPEVCMNQNSEVVYTVETSGVEDGGVVKEGGLFGGDDDEDDGSEEYQAKQQQVMQLMQELDEKPAPRSRRSRSKHTKAHTHRRSKPKKTHKQGKKKKKQKARVRGRVRSSRDGQPVSPASRHELAIAKAFGLKPSPMISL